MKWDRTSFHPLYSSVDQAKHIAVLFLLINGSPMKSHQLAAEQKMPQSLDKLPTVMRAIRVHQYGGPEVLKYDTDVPLPRYLDTQVLIKVFTVGVNPSEVYARSGSIGGSELPFIPGSDCAGVVVGRGDKVTNVQHGDRVYTVQTVTGSYAEYTVAEQCHVFRLHDDLTFSQGAALGVPYFTAYRALFFLANCKTGETVLVHGASGGVGLACCQIARAYRMNVLATAGSEQGLDVIRNNQITAVFNHKEKDYINKIQEASGEHGVDIICEMLACKNLKSDISLLARHGRIMVIGCKRQVTFNPGELYSGETSIQAVSVFSSSEEEYRLMADALRKGVEAGWLRPVIDGEFPLAEAAAAHREITEHPKGAAGKIILSL